MEVVGVKKQNWYNMLCPVCGEKFHLKKSAIPKAYTHYCSRACLNIAKKERFLGERNHQYGLKGDKNASWKGGRKKSHYGYWLVQCIGHPFAWQGQDYVFEHRLVAEKYLLNEDNSVVIDGKRYLSPEYIVHHKRGIRTDSRPENHEAKQKSEE